MFSFLNRWSNFFLVMWMVLGFAPIAGADVLDDISPGHWYRVANSDLDQKNPCASDNCSWSGSGFKGIMLAWSGGTFDTSRDRLLIFGGGHGDYFGNDVYAFDVDTRQWVVVREPTSNVGGNESSGLYPDGTPRSRHTYNSLEYSPELDSLVVVGAPGTAPQSTNGDSMVHLLSMDGSPQWSRAQNVPANGTRFGVTVRDPDTGHIWYQASGAGQLARFNPANNTWQSYGSRPMNIYASGAFDPVRKQMLVLGGNNNGNAMVWDVSGGTPTVTNLLNNSTFNNSNSFGLHTRQAPGLAYDAVSDRFVMWDGGATVYTINPDTWAVERRTAASGNPVTPTQASQLGTYGRFRYIPSRNLFIIVSETDEDVYFYRLAPGGGVPSAPTVTISTSPSTVGSGGSSTVNWSSTNATSCTASGAWSGSQDTSGSLNVTNITSAQTYTLSCTGAGGTTQNSTSIAVSAGAAPTVTLNASSSSVLSGGSVVLDWSSTNADSCSASGAWSGSRATSGTVSVGPLTLPSQFTLTCSNANGTGDDSVSVAVTPPSSDVYDILQSDTGAHLVNYALDGATVSGLIFPYTSPDTGIDQVRFYVDDPDASGSPYNVENVTPYDLGGGLGYETSQLSNGAHSFTAQLFLTGGASELVTVNFNVQNGSTSPEPVVSLQAAPVSIAYGAFSTLQWSTTDATSCEASGAWNGSRGVSGSASVGPLTDDSNFILVCSGPGGSDTATVTVLVAPAPAPTVTVTATPASVPYNGASQISWTTTNATACTASGAWTGSRATSGSDSVGPLQQNSNYVLTCSGPGGQSADTASVIVAAPPAPSISISAAPNPVDFNGAVTVTWSVGAANSCSATGDWAGIRPVSGTLTLGPLTTDRTYGLTCTGDGGTRSQSVNVSVTDAPAPTLTLTATPSSVAYEGQSSLTWATTNATSCIASGDWNGTRGTAGTLASGPLTDDATFSLTCSGIGGSVTRSAAVAVAAPPAPAITFAGSPTTVDFNGAATLTWSVSNATACSASGGWSGSRGLLGTTTVGPLQSDTDYVLSCSGIGGTNSATVTINVNDPPPIVALSASPDAVAFNGSTTLAWSSVNAQSCVASGNWSGSRATSGSQTIGSLTVDASFTMTCTGSGGSDSVTRTVAVAAAGSASLSLQAAPNTVSSGGTSVLSWSSDNVSSCSASGAWSGNRGVNGTETVGPLTADSTYTLSCTGVGGDVTRSTTVIILAPAPTVTLNATPGGIDYGGSVIVGWSSSNATSCEAFGGWSGSRPVSGSAVITSLTEDTDFLLICAGPGGEGTGTFSVTVGPAPAPVITLTPTPAQISAGATATLSWSATPATRCDAAGGWSGQRPVAGTAVVGPLDVDTDFSLVCTGPGGQSSQSTTVSVNVGAPTLTVTASPTTVDYDGSTQISWSSTGTSVCTAFGSWSGTLATTGTQTIGNLTKVSEFIVFCEGVGGSISDSVTVDVGSPPAPSITLMADPESVSFEGSTTLSWTTENATECTSFGSWSGDRPTDGVEQVGPLTAAGNYILLCTGPGGNTARSVQVTVDLPPAPQISFSTAPEIVAFGGTATLSWEVAFADSCTASGGWSGSVAERGTQAVGPLFATTSYTLVCSGPGGDSSRSLSVNVASAADLPIVTHETLTPGAAVPGWLQTGANFSLNFTPFTFEVEEFNANNVMAVGSSGADYHNHYGLNQSSQWSNYRFAGRMFVDATNASIGATVLSAYPTRDAYYAVSYDGSGAFGISARGTTCNGDLTTGVAPQGDTWYRYSIEAESTDVATLLRAKVWRDGDNEPAAFQAQCQDTSAGRMTTGSVGVRGGSSATGRARFDDLVVVSLDGQVTPPPALFFSAAPTLVVDQGLSTLTWSSTNASLCTASGDWSGVKPTGGNESVGPLTKDSSFTLVCEGDGGSISRSVAIAVVGVTEKPVVTFSASPDSVPTGGSTQLSWTAENAIVCAASGDWGGVYAPVGSQTIRGINKDSTFALNCIGPAGSTVATVDVLLSDIPRDPVLEFDIDYSTLPVDNTVVLRWETRYTSSCTASGGWNGSRDLSAVETVGPIGNNGSDFTLTCTGTGGDVSSTRSVSYIDSDSDGMPDVWEEQFFGSLVNNGQGDTDGDGLSDRAEYVNGTNPFDTDTDGDGDSDFDEVNFGSNPRDPGDTFGGNRPRQPELTAGTDLPLWGFTADSANGYQDPDGDPLGASEWEFALDENYQQVLFSRTVDGSTAAEVPAGVMDPGVRYFVRTRHHDLNGVPSLWSQTVTLTAAQSYPNDADNNGIDDDDQPPANADANANGIADVDEGLCNLFDAEGRSVVGFQSNSGVIRCFRSVGNSELPAMGGLSGETPFGTFSFRVEGLFVDPSNPARVFVTVWFPEDLDPDTGWLLYDPASNELIDYSANVTINGNRAIVTYIDGELGDKDGIVNGVIVDPSGPLVPVATTPPPTPPPPAPPPSDPPGGGGGGGTPSPLGLLMLMGWWSLARLRTVKQR